MAGAARAQASCLVSMLVVLSYTDWEHEAQRAKELTGRRRRGREATAESRNRGKFFNSIRRRRFGRF
ncbi:hypothetical protein MLD38_029111 [Melastoma candidum]|uniref:Uncharacterized protein n=1 Tax=Melastoma candidum TaxID=119954 RepID=A0ACB9N4M0_9MYRT|nr:hypothetical protein MLD38_029111 [Melastoma candidum]